MHPRRLRLPAAALAAGLPVLLAGMLAAPSARVLVGPTDDTVRTVNADPPPESATDAALNLDGAHPPVSTALQVEDAVSRDGSGGGDSRGVPIRVSGTALPARVLIAYRHAADALRRSDPGCHLHWSLVAAIGKVESGHAYGGALDRSGRTLSPILGPVLDGAGNVAAIGDSDGGELDGDSTWDRAVGPMQFIPTSWAVWGRDGDADGRSDPSDIDDAALATASYLCAGDRDLTEEKDRRSAVFSYNHSWDYVDLVLAWADAYATGTPVSTVRLAGAREDRSDDRPGRATAPIAGPAATGPTAAATPTPTPAVQAPASAAPTVAPDPAPSSSPPPDDGPAPTSDPSTACPTATPAPTSSPTGSPTGTATGEPTATPTESPTVTETPSPTPTPTGTESTATPTGAPTPTATTTGCPTPPAP
jgi:membrane-bound lytic murein transglycosylase B